MSIYRNRAFMIHSHSRAVFSLFFQHNLQRRLFSNTVILPSVNTIRSPTTRHRNKQWSQMLQELLDYRKTNGDTLVPAEFPANPQLATWVDTQRQQYRMYQEHQHLIHMHRLKQTSSSSSSSSSSDQIQTHVKKSNLTQERIQILETNGFIWDVHALKWEERFQELVQYKNTHGTVIVPKTGPYETLYNWVFTQRRQYKFKQAGMDHSSLTQERIDKLDALGFIWNYPDEVWMEKFQELVKFKRDHGHCLIPSTYFNRSLAKWVEVQRMHYRNIKKQQQEKQSNQSCVSDSPLTEIRIRLLNEQEFCWNVAEYHWNLHLEQLKNFIQLNGHAWVPTSIALGRWCQKQRIEYFKMIRGEKTSMTDERRDQLIALGFLFEIQNLNGVLPGMSNKHTKKKRSSRMTQK